MNAIESGTAISARSAVVETPTDVVAEVLAADAEPTADGILNALGSAGYLVIRPDNGSPAWMPVTPRSLAKVQRLAALINDGKSHVQAAAEMRVSVRHIERYGAAARQLGLIDRRR